MKNSDIDSLNRITIPQGEPQPISPELLWLNAACNENKFTLNPKPHNHAFFEMHIVMSGSIVYRFKDKSITLSKNELIVIPPRVIHCIPRESRDFRKMTVAFDLVDSHDRERRLFPNEIIKNCLRVVPIENELLDSLGFILKHASTKERRSELMIKNRLVEMISLVALDSLSSLSTEHADRDTRIVKAKKYVEDNPQLFLSCEEVASYCNLSSKHLGRLFLLHEGVTLLSFIHGTKIEEAKRLLTESDLLLETVSSSLGFSSVNYFGKFFAKHTGITPSDYRLGKRKTINES